MEITLNEAGAHTTLKDLDFRSDSMHLKFHSLRLRDLENRKKEIFLYILPLF